MRVNGSRHGQSYRHLVCRSSNRIRSILSTQAQRSCDKKLQDDPADASGKLATAAPTTPPIRFEEAVPLTQEEERRLVKVKDKRLLVKIDRAIPIAAQTAARVDAVAKVAKAVEAHNKTVESLGQLYRAIIPKGAQLAESQAIEGAKRGIYHGAKGIRSHANLIAVDTPKVDPGVGKELVPDRQSPGLRREGHRQDCRVLRRRVPEQGPRANRRRKEEQRLPAGGHGVRRASPEGVGIP